MRKIVNCAVGVLVLALASPTAIGQEKPKVEVVKPKIGPVKRQNLQDLFNEVALRVQLNQAPPNAQAQGRMIQFVWRQDGQDLVTVLHPGTEAQPLMQGDPKTVVEEIEKALRGVQGDDLAKGLAALDAVQRAIMKARTLLRTQKDLIKKPSVAELRALSQVRFFRAALQQSDTTPLWKARSAVEQAVVTVRQATNVEEAKKGFDEVEKTTAALRSLLWELNPKKG